MAEYETGRKGGYAQIGFEIMDREVPESHDLHHLPDA